MTRRSIDSETWSDEFFGMLPYFEGLAWIGLFSKCADNQGRFVDNPALIARNLFPYKEVTGKKMSAAIDLFGSKALRYEVDGQRYIQLTTWWKHQPLQYAVPSNYPPHPGWLDRIRTTYKGKHYVFNWPGQQDTELGILLMNKLGSLGRVSSWTDYVDVLNPVSVSNTVINPPYPPKTENRLKSDFDISSANSFVIYERLFGQLTPKSKELIIGLENEYSVFAVLQAMKEAYFNDAQKISYVTAILRNWKIEKRLPVAESDDDGGRWELEPSGAERWVSNG